MVDIELDPETLAPFTGGREGSEETIHITTLLPETFVNEYTKFGTVEEFFEESPWDVQDSADLKAIPREELDGYVDEHSSFESWAELTTEAEARVIDTGGY
ncbi:MAG: hypothetical protein ABEI52_06640 [Halobacteriaceae archaeon]